MDVVWCLGLLVGLAERGSGGGLSVAPAAASAASCPGPAPAGALGLPLRDIVLKTG